MGEDSQLLSPRDDVAAPINSRVTVQVARRSSGKLVLRPVGGNAVAVTERRHETGWVDLVVLSPTKPLLPRVRYEVALVGGTGPVPTQVFGTFATGASEDSKPPKLARPSSTRSYSSLTAANTS